MIENEKGFHDLVDENNSQRMRARIEHRHRMGRMHLVGASVPRTEGRRPEPADYRPRALPSGPAPSWPMIALALLFLTVIASTVSVGLGFWMLSRLVVGMGNLVKGWNSAANS